MSLSRAENVAMNLILLYYWHDTVIITIFLMIEMSENLSIYIKEVAFWISMFFFDKSHLLAAVFLFIK